MSKKKLTIIITASVLAALVLIAGLIFWLTGFFKDGSSSNGGNATITVGAVSGEVGKTVKVPVKLANNPGAMGFLLRFEYDTEALEYINFEKGELLSDCEVSNKDGVLTLVSVEDNDITDNGVMVYLSFKIKDGASGKSEIKLVCDENSVCNYDEDSILVKAVNGEITVK